MHCRVKRQSVGAALLSALFIMALVAVLATAIAEQQSLLINSSELVLGNDRAYLALQGVQEWAREQLIQYQQKVSHKQVVNAYKGLKPLHKQSFEGIELSGELIDLQGRFNINNLRQSQSIPLFSTMLQAINSNISHEKAQVIGTSIFDWMRDQSNDDYYTHLRPPHRPGHRPMALVTELRSVRGVTASLYRQIQPYLCALPVSSQVASGSSLSQATSGSNQTMPGPQMPDASGVLPSVSIERGRVPGGGQQGSQLPVNINSASAAVLMTLAPTMSLDKALAIVSCRKQHGAFATVAQFNKACVAPTGLTALSNITTHSHYFLLKSQAKLGSQMVSLTSMLGITQQQTIGMNAGSIDSGPKPGLVKVSIIWQALN